MYYRITLICNELYQHDLEDIATFLQDLVYLYDRLALLAPYNLENLRRFKNIYTSNYFYRRFSRPLPKSDRLKVSHIHLYSPLSIELILSIAFGFPVAAKVFVELIKIIRDWNVEKERKELENVELKLRILKQLEGYEKELGFSDFKKLGINLSKEDLLKLIENDIKRLYKHNVRIIEI